MTLLRTRAILALAISGAAWSQGDSSSVSGRVLDDSGNPLQGAMVWVQRVPEVSQNQLGQIVVTGVRFSASAQSDPAGGYSIGGLPAGRYAVCAEPATAGYLGSCDWTGAFPPTQVAAGASLAMAPLILRKGTVVQLIADDPSGLIQPASGAAATKAQKHHFFPSVETAAGYFSSALPTGQSGTQRTFTVTIPKTATVELFFDTDLSVTTTVGAAVAADVRSGITVTGGPASVTVEVAVK